MRCVLILSAFVGLLLGYVIADPDCIVEWDTAFTTGMIPCDPHSEFYLASYGAEEYSCQSYIESPCFLNAGYNAYIPMDTTAWFGIWCDYQNECGTPDKWDVKTNIDCCDPEYVVVGNAVSCYCNMNTGCWRGWIQYNDNCSAWNSSCLSIDCDLGLFVRQEGTCTDC